MRDAAEFDILGRVSLEPSQLPIVLSCNACHTTGAEDVEIQYALTPMGHGDILWPDGYARPDMLPMVSGSM